MINLEILFIKIAVKFVYEIAAAKTPSKIYESAVSKFPFMPSIKLLRVYIRLPEILKTSPSGMIPPITPATKAETIIASITLHLKTHKTSIKTILIKTGLLSINFLINLIIIDYIIIILLKL